MDKKTITQYTMRRNEDKSKKALRELYSKVGLTKKEKEKVITGWSLTKALEEFSPTPISEKEYLQALEHKRLETVKRKKTLPQPRVEPQQAITQQPQPRGIFSKIFGSSPSMTRRGTKIGSKQPRTFQKYKYNSKGRIMSITPSFSRALRNAGIDTSGMSKKEKRKVYSEFDIRIDDKTGKLQYRRIKITPPALKRAFSKVSAALQPREKQSDWMQQRENFYRKQQELHGKNFNLHNYVFTESEVAQNQNKEDYLKSLQNSQAAWLIGQQQQNIRRELAKRTIKQQTENLKASQIVLAENMFSSEAQRENKAVDILQNQFAHDEANNIMTQRADSIDILTGARKQGRPNVLQIPKEDNILSNKNNLKFF